MYFVLMGEWNPLNELFKLGGRLFNPPKGKHLLKRPESNHCEVNTSGILLVILACFLRFLKGVHFRNRLQNLSGATKLSMKNFQDLLNMFAIQSGIARYHSLYTQGYSPGNSPKQQDSIVQCCDKDGWKEEVRFIEGS